MTTAVFPGSFDPLTVAHLAIVDAVRSQRGIERLDLVISRRALGKEDAHHSPVTERMSSIEDQRHGRPWLRADATDDQLLVDIASGYDVLVLGADKWHQVHDPGFYGGSVDARDDAVARLPRLAVVPRAGVDLPASVVDAVLRIPVEFQEVSSTAVRAGRDEWRA